MATAVVFLVVGLSMVLVEGRYLVIPRFDETYPFYLTIFTHYLFCYIPAKWLKNAPFYTAFANENVIYNVR